MAVAAEHREDLPERSRIVYDALLAGGVDPAITVLPSSARTAAEAAAALGCDVGATGQVIGEVAPVGHPAPLPTIIDRSLADHDQLWAAGGTPHTIFPLAYAELVTITDGREEHVGN